tara:strand:+ start:173 stop:442 length:270 start_codon:yes stop_codon:yes gene_type:complete
MSSYDYNDLTRQGLPKQVRDARMKKVSQVYKDAQANTDPHREDRDSPPPEYQAPKGNSGGMMITPDVLEELNRALYHLQQVVLKLGGGA